MFGKDVDATKVVLRLGPGRVSKAIRAVCASPDTADKSHVLADLMSIVCLTLTLLSTLHNPVSILSNDYRLFILWKITQVCRNELSYVIIYSVESVLA